METTTTLTAPDPAIALAEAALAAELAAIDFDVPESAEDDAIKALSVVLAPRFVIVEKSLAVKFPTGKIIKISLDVPFEKFEEIVASDGDDADQFNQILDFLGDSRAQTILRAEGTVAVMATAQKYFTVWQKVVGASLGESNGSGPSV